jgi:hypothetical protein
MSSGYRLSRLEDIPALPATVTTPIPIPAGYTLVPTPAPAPITAASGGLNLDWQGNEIRNPPAEALQKDPLIPVVEVHPDGHAVGKPAFVRLHELDSLACELCDDFDFGLAQYKVQNPHELGKLSIQGPKLTMPKLSFSIGKGQYTPLKIASAIVGKAPVRAAVKAVQKTGKKPIVLARKKPEQSNSARTSSIADMYAALKKQGQLVNLLATKKQVAAEHNKRMDDDSFRQTVMDLLRKIEKQCAGDTSGNYFARWNKLKAVTGVNVHEKT